MTRTTFLMLPTLQHLMTAGSPPAGRTGFVRLVMPMLVALLASLPICTFTTSAVAGTRIQDETPADDSLPQEPDLLEDPGGMDSQEPVLDDPLQGLADPPKSDADQGSETQPGSDSKSGSNSKQEPAPNPGSDTKSDPGEDMTAGSDTTGEAAATDLAFEKFQQLLNEVQTNERQIKQLVISMPVGFRDKRQAQQAKIEMLRARNQAILGELKPLAIESFEKFPNTQEFVTTYLFQNLQFQLNGKSYRLIPFDPFAAMTAIQRLSNGGVNLPVLHMFGYQTYYILNDFEGAKNALQQAAALGQVLEPRVWDDLRQIGEAWNRELEFRKQDREKQNPLVQIELDCGEMTVELFEDQAPNTVANFITLVEDGFYNGLIFYQVNPTEVAITGSPTNDGQGGPGYSIGLETSGEDIRHHFTGVLSMVPDGQNLAASRFLITKQPRLQFNGRLPAFGRIIEGLENLYKIQVVNRTTPLSSEDTTVPTRINKMTVVRKRDHEYIVEKATNNPAPLPGG